jgi:homoserine dehydrogenase
MLMQKSSNQRLLFIGFGNVGQKIAELFVSKSKHYPGLSKFDPKIVGIFTKWHGAIVNQGGIDLVNSVDQFVKEKQFTKSNPDFSNIPVIEAIQKLNYDCMVDISTLTIKEKGEPAVSYTKEALKRGISVVSANKGPAAFSSSDLYALASKYNCKFLHESTVMDGAPIFNLYKDDLKGCEIKGLSGILNLTTNFILTKMEEGISFEKSVKEVRKLGFGEDNIMNDIDGWDSVVKITILANKLMAASITPTQVIKEGIGNITKEQVQNACERGYHLKLICRAYYEQKKLLARVMLEEVPDDHIFSKISNTGAVLRIETDLMNPIMIVQENPSILDTAYGVISDLLSVFGY